MVCFTQIQIQSILSKQLHFHSINIKLKGTYTFSDMFMLCRLILLDPSNYLGLVRSVLLDLSLSSRVL